MSLLLYAIAERPAEALRGPGLDGRTLKALGSNGLLAIVSEHDAPSSDATEERLWEYEQVVEALMDRQPILPARYGSLLADEGAAETLLRSRHHQLTVALDNVRDAVELGIRCRWRAEQIGGDSGTAYMEERLDRRRRARAIAQRLEPLQDLARSALIRVLAQPDVPVVAAYLVDRDRVDEFAALVARLDERLDDVALVCTGPWPPYSFTQGGGS